MYSAELLVNYSTTVYRNFGWLGSSPIFSALHGMPARTDYRKVSVSPMSNAWIVSKRKKDLSRFYTVRKII